MKKLIFCVVITVLTFSCFPLKAQYDPKAKEILDKMSENFKSAGGLTGTFTQNITNKTEGINEKLKGTITIKGEKYKLILAENEIYNNGKEIWVFNPEINEVTVSAYDPESEDITPGNVFDIYKKGFKYNLLSSQKNGMKTIELNPESRDEVYFKISMTIDEKNNLKQFIIFDKNGTQYRYAFTKISPLETVSSSFFTFDTQNNPDVEVIDFR